MRRENLIVEVMKRLYSIKTDNGYPLTVSMVVRNPENEPEIDHMPMTNLFEFPEITLDEAKRRGASQPPIYTKEMTIVMEHWYVSASRGETTKDIYQYLSSARKAIFQDGITLGRLCSGVEETEISRIYRPPIGNNVVGVGQVLVVKFVEDFANL